MVSALPGKPTTFFQARAHVKAAKLRFEPERGKMGSDDKLTTKRTAYDETAQKQLGRSRKARLFGVKYSKYPKVVVRPNEHFVEKMPANLED